MCGMFYVHHFHREIVVYREVKNGMAHRVCNESRVVTFAFVAGTVVSFYMAWRVLYASFSSHKRNWCTIKML